MAYISKKTTVNGVKPIGSNLFGTCSTASATAQKDVTMADFDVLVSGVTIHVYFTHKNTASNPTLKVGSTSAVTIKCNGASDGVWEDGAVISFTYNGSAWVQNDAIGSGGVTYSISASGDTVTLTGSDGSTSSATVADNDTTYGISISGNTLSLVEGGSGTQVTLPNDNTTYTISVSGHTLTLTPSSGTAQTVTLPDDDTTYELERNLETITHMFYVNMDGLGYFYDEDNLVINNDGYDYLYNHENSVYIVDANGNDIANISNVDLCNLPSTAYTWTLQFGQYLVDYFATATEYRLKINGQLTQKIRKQGYYYDLQETIGGYDSVTAEDWYIDVNEGYIYILTTGVVVGDHNTIDLVGSDGTTTSVAIKAIDIGALPTARWQLNSVAQDGYVEAPGSIHPNCAWATNSNGDPSWRRLVDMFYPVGSYYETSNANFNPNTAWGGTWSRIAKKQVIKADGSNVSMSPSTHTTICSITLPANGKYLVVGYCGTGRGAEETSNSDILLMSGTGSIRRAIINSVKANSGQQLPAVAWVETTTACVVAVRRYNYTSATITGVFGTITAIPIDNFDDGNYKWHRTA